MQLTTVHNAPSTVGPDPKDIARVVAMDSIGGTAVYNRAGQALGALDRLMIDKIAGKIVFAVVSIGGAADAEHRRYVLPWSLLTYDALMGGYLVNVDHKILENGPTFGADAHIDLNSEAWCRTLHDYYRVPHFWI